MLRPILSALLLTALIIPPSASGAGGPWRSAVVDSMAGRFGAFMEGYRYRRMGYLSLISDGLDVYSVTFGDNLHLGRPHIPGPYTREDSYSWVCAEKDFTLDRRDGSRGEFRIYESLLAPGFLYDSTEPVFRWCWNEQTTGQQFILPLKGGAVCNGEGDRYLAGRDGPLADNWLLVSFSGSRHEFDCPLLFIFENSPEQIEVVTHEFLDIRFTGEAGKVIVMPLYGMRKVAHSESARWADEVPDDIVRACSRWRERLSHYPVAASEEYRFDGDGGLEVRNVYLYVSFAGTTGEPLAPVPPFVRMARLTGYPVDMAEEPVRTGYPTSYGWLDYATGSELIYKIPATEYVDYTIAPVRVKGVPGIGRVETRLEQYLHNVNWTWPGDHDYDPDGVMDTMHNLRLLARAAWSLEPRKRREAIDDLAHPGVERVSEGLYHFFEDPVAGRTYARDSTIFAQRGRTSYDSDWYNGFQLAGLWAWRYFGNREQGLRLAREKWDIWNALADYMLIYHGWAVCCSHTDPRGNLIDYDCMRNGWSGLLAHARLARDLGDMERYRRSLYLASKTMVAHYVQWQLQDYLYELANSYEPGKGRGFLRWEPEELTGVDRLDSYGPHEVTSPDDTHPYNLSACIPEHALFLSDYGLEPGVEQLTYDNLGRYIPDWADFDPYAVERPGHWSAANAAAGRYFYFLDPHLFVRAVVFHEPLERLLSYRPLEWLSGQAIEAMLAGSRPMLLVPTDAEFHGNLWDETAHSLEFTLEGRGERRLEIRNCDRPAKVEPPTAGMSYDAERRTAKLDVRLEGMSTFRVYF